VDHYCFLFHVTKTDKIRNGLLRLGYREGREFRIGMCGSRDQMGIRSFHSSFGRILARDCSRILEEG